MVNPFICGKVRLVDYSFVDVPAPIGGMYAYEGINQGRDGGCKGKTDYLGRFWFFACNDPITPTVMYLCRCKDNGDGTFTIAYKQLPTYADIVITPNQLTIDKSGNVYFPIGANALNSYVVAKVTTNDFDSANPLPGTIYNSIAKQDTYIGTYGIALNKAHSRVMTYVRGTGANGSPTNDHVGVLATATMTELRFDDMGGRGTFIPYNIETDVSGGVNNDYSFFITKISSQVIFIYNMAAGTLSTKAANEIVVAVDRSGNVLAMERTKRCLANPNQISSYPPGPAAGQLQNGTLIYLTCVVPKPGGGNTTTMEAPTHHDIRRSTNDIWPADGIGAVQGDVREIKTVAQNARALTTVYRYICTAAVREAYT